MRIPAVSFITNYKSTAKPCNLSPEQARDAFLPCRANCDTHTRTALGPRLCHEFGILPSQRELHRHVQDLVDHRVYLVRPDVAAHRGNPGASRTHHRATRQSRRCQSLGSSWTSPTCLRVARCHHETETEAELLKPNMCSQPSRSSRCGRIHAGIARSDIVQQTLLRKRGRTQYQERTHVSDNHSATSWFHDSYMSAKDVML